MIWHVSATDWISNTSCFTINGQKSQQKTDCSYFNRSKRFSATKCQNPKLEPKSTKSVAFMYATDFQSFTTNTKNDNNRKNKIGCKNYSSLTLYPKAAENYVLLILQPKQPENFSKLWKRWIIRISVAFTTEFSRFFLLPFTIFYNPKAVFGWTFHQPKKWKSVLISVLVFRWISVICGDHQTDLSEPVEIETFTMFVYAKLVRRPQDDIIMDHGR